MPNLVSSLAVLVWIPITLALFVRSRPVVAAAVSILGAGILLPVGVGPDVPGLPPLTRERIAVVMVLAFALTQNPRALRSLRTDRWLLVFPLITVASPLIGALTNRDPYLQMHVMTLKDGVTVAIGRALDLSIPFLLGLALVRKREDLRTLLVILSAAALMYSVLVLFEVRMSPKLHREIYGFLPHSGWGQTKRFGGWRPTVFMPHGIALARFLLLATLAAAVLYRSRRPIMGVNALAATLYLAIVLLLTKSLGAIILCIAILPIVLALRPRHQAAIVLILGMLVLSYPGLRVAGLFPTRTLVSTLGRIDEERGHSLGFRFFNEDLLIEHALERPLFGWGGWSRNRVYDPVTGEDLSRATDGYWIIIFGYQGLTGLAGLFGILLGPPLLAAFRARRIRSERLRFEVVGLAMLITVNAIDLLPNGFLMSFVVFASGALAGALPDVIESKGHRRARRSSETTQKGAIPPLPGRIASLTEPDDRSGIRR